MSKKKTFVDVAMRLEVPHGVDEDPMEIVNEANFTISIDDTEIQIMDVVVSGTCDEESGALVREDGATGRDVCLLHDPPID